MKKKIGFLFFTLAVSDCYALAIDNMLYFSDENYNARINLINNDVKKAYVKTNMSKVEVVDNELKVIPLTNQNIGTWKLTITPSKTILAPNQSKYMMVHYSCGDCTLEKDEIYKLSLAPIPYGDDGKLQKIQVGFGFAPYVIVPATIQKPSYELKFDSSGKLIFNNMGNTYLTAIANYCDKKMDSKCSLQLKMLPGRKKAFELNSKFKSKNKIEFKVVNYDESFKDSYTVVKE